MSDSQRAAARPSNFLFLPLILVLAFTGCVSSKAGSLVSDKVQKTARADAQHDEEVQVKNPSPKNILKTAFSQVGNPYRYGGTSPETGFDCSGFVKWVYGQYDIRLPRSSGDMIGSGKVVERKELKPGDLVFFGRKKRITHVGIYTGDDKYIHSPRTGKSIEESPLASRARGEYFVGARRILPNVNVEAIDDELKRLWMARQEQAGDETASVEAAQSVPAANDPSSPVLTIDVVEPSDGPVQLAGASGEILPSFEAAAIEADSPSSSINPAEMGAPPVEKVDVVKNAPAKKHRVVAGDTIYGLARKYGVSGEALAQANNLSTNKTVLKLGQVLVIPAMADAKMAKAEGQAKADTKTAKAEASVRPESKASIDDIQAQPAPLEKTAVVQHATGKIAMMDADEQGTPQNIRQHKVVAGDTLYSLARRYGLKTDALAKANNFADKDKAVLKLGQMLVVPVKTGSPKVAQSASADVGTPAPEPQSAKVSNVAKPKGSSGTATGKKSRQHKVASGDTLYDLARKYGISTDALAKANNLNTKKNVLKLGQVLVVPPKTKAN